MTDLGNVCNSVTNYYLLEKFLGSLTFPSSYNLLNIL